MLRAEPDWPHCCKQLENAINEERRQRPGFSQQKELRGRFFNVIKANCCDRGVKGKGLVSDCWQGHLGSGEMWMVQAAYSLQLLTLNISTEGEIF